MSDDKKVIFSMSGLTKTYQSAQTPVLKNIYLSFFYGAKIGILGLNGSGKSTLLRIIAGEEKNYQGDVVFAPGYTVGYLEQEPKLDETKTVLEVVKEGAKMVNAVSNSVVPKFTIVIGNSYGAGNYAMCGKAYDPRLIVAWPSAELAVMSGNSAAKVLLQIETATLKKQGKEITEEEEMELYNKIKARYDKQISPYYAASRIWTDAVIDPLDTRKWISMGIEAANHAPIEKAFNLGVIQV